MFKEKKTVSKSIWDASIDNPDRKQGTVLHVFQYKDLEGCVGSFFPGLMEKSG